MQMIIKQDSMVPIYEQLVQQIKAQIISGRLKEGDALLSTRLLAKNLKISALTVKKAYDILDQDGFIVTVHGKGSFVLAVNPQQRQEQRLQEIENDLERIIEKSRLYEIDDEQVKELLRIIMEEPI